MILFFLYGGKVISIYISKSIPEQLWHFRPMSEFELFDGKIDLINNQTSLRSNDIVFRITMRRDLLNNVLRLLAGIFSLNI